MLTQSKLKLAGVPGLVACGGMFFAVGAAFGQAPAAPAPDSPSPLAEAKTAIGKWVETQQLISKEKLDWREAREVLKNRIELMKREINEVEESILKATTNTEEVDKKTAEARKDNDRYKAASDLLEAEVKAAEARFRTEVLPLLPPPIADKIKALTQRIPENPDETKLTVSERFQNVIGSLNEANRFNREVTVTSEVKEIGEGRTAEVSVLYLGFGRAYYVNQAGDKAGIGVPGAKGWEWTEANEHAAAVAQAVGIVQGKKVAAFVPLPVEVK